MATKPSNVVLNFKMDGQVQYAETLKQINQVMNTAAKEYKNHIAAMGNDASATDKLRAEKKKLEIQMEGAQKRTKMLRAEYEAMGKDTNATTDQLTAMYGKLLDSERAETSLQKSLERVNAGLSDQAQDARDAKDRLDGLKGEAKLLDAEQKNLTSSFKLQTAELGKNATETEKAELAQKQFDAQMGLTERAVQNLEQQLNATKTAYGENSVEVMQLETKLNEAKTTVKQFSDSLENIESGGDSAADGMENLGKKIDANTLMEGAEALQAVSDKLLEIGTAAFDSALSFADAQIDMQSNLGLTNDEAVELAGVMEDVYKRGVVESVEEATEAVKATYAAFGYLNALELSDLTDQIVTLAKRTGTDVVENVNAASKMMGAFKITEEEAFDLMAAGFQNGLNSSGDFLDTLNEYSPHFAAAGFSANEMLQIIENGMLNGSMNTDKAADAVKELQIRMGDGSFEKIMGSFSGETQGMFEQWKNGQATVSDVATSISGDLAKMTPTEQQAALSILSSQFEDLGVDGAAALFNVGDSFDVVNGKMDEMAQKTPSEEFQASLRDLQTELLPLGQKLVEIAQDVLPKVIEAVGKLKEWFDNMAEPMKTFITALGGVSAVVVVLSPVIATVVAGFIAFGSTMGIVLAAVAGVILVIAGIITAIKNWGAISDWLKEKFASFGIDLDSVFQSVKAVIESVVQAVSDFVMNVWGQMVAWWNENNELIRATIDTVWGYISEKVQNILNVIVPAIQAAWDTIKMVTQTVWELIKGVIQIALDVVLGVVKTAMQIINGNWTGAWNTIKGTVSSVWETIKSTVANAFSAISSNIGNVMSGISTTVTNAWNTIKSGISNAINGAKDAVSSAIGTIKSIMNFSWSLPNLKLPKFSVTGSFSLNPPSVPHLSVDWRAKGGIFTQPTIFGAANGRLQGIGEAGPEAALPLNAETLGAIGKGIAENMQGGGGGGTVIVPVYLDGKQIARVTAPYMDRELHTISRERDFGKGRKFM